MPRNPVQLVLQQPAFAAVLLKKPLLVRSVLKNLTRRRLRPRAVTLDAAEYAVTYACDARCSHCSAAGLHDVAAERHKLDERSLRRHADALFGLGVYEVNLTGGEPTLRRDLERIVGCFRPERTFIGLNSHGLHLDADRVRSLADAGVDLLKLSLDSDDASTHDAGRHLPGAFEHVRWLLSFVKTVPALRAHICAVGSEALIRSGGARSLIDLAAANGATIGFTLPVAVGRWGGHYEVELPPAVLDELRRLCQHPAAFLQGNHGSDEFRCPAGRHEVYLTPWGEVLPCPFVQRSFGDLRTEPLDVVTSRIAAAIDAAGARSLCLAGDAQRWMKKELPGGGVRLALPTCAAEHPGRFCFDPQRPERA